MKAVEAQNKILFFLKEFQAKEQRSPTIKEIMIAMIYKSPRAVSYHLDKMEAIGLISRRNGARNVVIVGDYDNLQEKLKIMTADAERLYDCLNDLTKAENEHVKDKMSDALLTKLWLAMDFHFDLLHP